MTWVFLSGSRNQIEIESDPRHREIFLAQMNLDAANVKSVTTPAVKIQEWTPQMLTKIDRSTFRSATMRASYMFINCVDVQQAVKEGSTVHVRAERGSVDHAQASGSTPCKHYTSNTAKSCVKWLRRKQRLR